MADLVLRMLHYPQLHPLTTSSSVMWLNVKYCLEPLFITMGSFALLTVPFFAYVAVSDFTRMGSNFWTKANSITPFCVAQTTDPSLWNLSSDTFAWGTHLRKIFSKWLSPISSNIPTLRNQKMWCVQTIWVHDNTDMHSFNQVTTLFLISVKRILMGSDKFFSSSHIKPND